MESNETLVITGSDIFPKELHRSEQLGFDVSSTPYRDPISRWPDGYNHSQRRIAHQTLSMFLCYSCSPYAAQHI